MSSESLSTAFLPRRIRGALYSAFGTCLHISNHNVGPGHICYLGAHSELRAISALPNGQRKTRVDENMRHNIDKRGCVRKQSPSPFRCVVSRNWLKYMSVLSRTGVRLANTCDHARGSSCGSLMWPKGERRDVNLRRANARVGRVGAEESPAESHSHSRLRPSVRPRGLRLRSGMKPDGQRTDYPRASAARYCPCCAEGGWSCDTPRAWAAFMKTIDSGDFFAGGRRTDGRRGKTKQSQYSMFLRCYCFHVRELL